MNILLFFKDSVPWAWLILFWFPTFFRELYYVMICASWQLESPIPSVSTYGFTRFMIISWALNSEVTFRLLHSHTPMAVGLAVGYKIWPLIGWHHLFLIGWSKYRLVLPQLRCIEGHVTCGNFNHFRRPLTVPLHSSNGRQIKAVQEDCEKV